MSKFYDLLSELPPPMRDGAHEILDAILASGELVNWNRQLRLVVNGRTYPRTNMVDLISHILNPHDTREEKPIGLNIFVDALKDIKLESDWVVNEVVKDVLDDADSDDSDSDDSDSDDSDSDDSNINASDDDEKIDEDDDEDDDEEEN